MSDQYGGAFGGYTNVTDVISAAGQTAVIAEVAKLQALIKDPDVDAAAGAARTPSPSPDFDRIHPALARQLHVELEALKAAIDAAPTA